MIPHPPNQKQLENPPAPLAPATWPYRLWLAQAEHLYRSPEAQRLAILNHIMIVQRHAPTVERLLWLDTLGRDLDTGRCA